MADDADDLRLVELGSLEAIYPEIRRPDEKDPFTFEIEVPVEPAAPVTVTFPAASANTLPGLNASALPDGNAQPEEDSLKVSHLPSLCLRIRLPEDYPVDAPPEITISANPQWLTPGTIRKLEDDGPRLWDEIGRDMVAFTYIDHVQRAAEDVFGTITPEGTLQMDPEHKLAVLDHDIKAKKAAFEKETFECGVCLDPKKGTKCHKMLDCDHIFCLQCLQDFYNDAITEGSLQTVRCLAPNCAKERSKVKDKDGATKLVKKPKIAISPSELLQIGLPEDTVKRYVNLKYKTELESDKNTIYCPRSWCNGAARSKRHKKPDGLEFAEGSDAESEPEDQGSKEKAGQKPSKKNKAFDPSDLLSVCEDCGFAFCGRCFQSWHGEFVRCQPPRKKGELTEEEKASLEYLQLHTSPCPTCNAPAQKTHGCNHMICSRCDTHFCYLCSMWLDPANPYRHYNTQPGGKVTSCFMRLWELEGGDGDNVGLGFVGGRAPAANEPEEEVIVLDNELELVLDDSDDEEVDINLLAGGNNNHDDRPLDPQGPAVGVAREAPLVLRLVDNQPRDARNGHRQVPPAAPDAPQPALREHGPHRGNAGRGRGRGGRGGGRGGAGAAAAAGAGARGRGGGAAAPRGGGGVANRRGQYQRQQHRQQPPRRPQQPQNQGQNNDDDDHNNNNGNGVGLDPAQEAWVRRFVQMALIDAEDEVEGDSDDDGDNFIIQ